MLWFIDVDGICRYFIGRLGLENVFVVVGLLKVLIRL